jgi:hypothetical protein
MIYLNIEISAKGLSEFDGNRRVIFIPKEEIQTIETGFGSSAERPLLQLIAGLLLVGLGLVGVAMIMASGMRGFRWGVGFLVFGGLGAWILYEAVKKSHFLRVICVKDTPKLVFRGTFRDVDCSKFITDGGGLGYMFKDGVKTGSR